MSYEALFARRAFGVRLDLQAIAAVHAALGRPAGSVPAVHVVGTNGKGSVAAMVDHALRGRGERVGLYTSPHLQRVTERVRVDGEEVSDEELRDAVDRVLAAEAPSLPRPLSFFEVLTLAALVVFEAHGVERLVVEAGMGGRLDATRLVAAEVVAVTSIALDHERWLGSTLAAIAWEKAGVFRPGVPVVTSPQAPEAMVVLEAEARRVGAPLELAAALPVAPAGLDGAHQRENGGVALALLRRIDPSFSASALDGVRWPARLERLAVGEGTVILDAGHNPAAMTAIADSLAGERLAAVIFGCQLDKDLSAMWASLAPLAPLWWVPLEPADPSIPVAPPREPARRFEGPDDPALALSIEAAAGSGGTVLVCGSHVLAGALRGRLTSGDRRRDASDPR